MTHQNCVIASAIGLLDSDERATVIGALKSRNSAAKVVDAIGEYPVTDTLPLSARAVIKHRRGECECANPLATVDAPEGVSRNPVVELDATGGTLTTGVLKAPVEDRSFSTVFQAFGMNPDEYSILNDSVRMSTWQQGGRNEDGEWERQSLYSYRATFVKRAAVGPDGETLDLTALEPLFRGVASRFRARAPRKGATPNGTYLIAVADPQLGKKGTQEAVENWQRGVKGHLQEVANLTKLGTPPEAIHVAFMGDETEGVCNSYRNQPHTVELNLSEQVELDTKLRTWTIREALATGLPVSVSSVISNHGETWVRNGGKDPVTTQSDNLSTTVARQVKHAFDTFAPEARLSWHIADSDPAVIVELSGVKVYTTHGHVQKGRGASTELRTKMAMERQIVSNPGRFADIPLFLTAHYHHESVITGEGRYYIGCPALEAEKSSEYMLDQYGVWSQPGMLGFLVGENVDARRPYTRLTVH